MPASLFDVNSLPLIQLATEKRAAFAKALDSAVKVNARTGAAKVDDKALFAALKLVLKPKDAKKTAADIKSFLSAGYLAVGGAKPVLIPWSTVQTLLDTSHAWPAQQVAKDLGLKRTMSAKAIQGALEKFTGIPDVLTTPQSAQQFQIRLKDRNSDAGPDPSTDHPKTSWGAGGSAYTPPPALPDAQKCLTTLGTWYASWWGVMLCVDSPCAQSLAAAIESLTIVGSFAEFGKTIVTAAVNALSSSSLVGLIVTIGIAFTGGVLNLWIETSDKGNGVCIRFYFPYLPFVGGTVLVTSR